MAPPIISPEQRERALAAATATRQARAKAKTALAKGEVTLTAVLDDTGSPLQGAKVLEILKSLPGVGPVKAASVMERAGIPGNRRVKGLGARQRQALKDEFEPALT